MEYVRNAWYVAAWSDQIEADKPFAMTILNERIVIYRLSDGRAAALEDRCVHRLAPLSLGRCEGDQLRCMYHGFLFDPDGRVVEIPGQDMIPEQARVKAYPVVERHSWIWIWMGDPALADQALIPPAVGLDDPDWILGHGNIDYKAAAKLINDNLLDFSHLTYVHANSFKAGPEHAASPPAIIPLDRGVRHQRWVTNSTRTPRGGDPEAGPMDNFGTYDFLLPGVLLMWSGSFPAGTAETYGGQAPDRSKAVAGVTFTSQAVTPMTDNSSRYFFSWGPHKGHGDAELRDQLMGIARMAFEEDRVMIEGQQQVIEATPDPKIMPSVHDKGVTLFNRLVARLSRAEQQPGK